MFNACLKNIVAVIVAQVPKSITTQPDGASAFVMRQYQRMPDLYRLPIFFLTLFFNLLAVVRYGASFNKLPPQKRKYWFLSWKNSRIGLPASFARFYESLVLLHIHEIP